MGASGETMSRVRGGVEHETKKSAADAAALSNPINYAEGERSKDGSSNAMLREHLTSLRGDPCEAERPRT
jgi:hypothetical protein